MPPVMCVGLVPNLFAARVQKCGAFAVPGLIWCAAHATAAGIRRCTLCGAWRENSPKPLPCSSTDPDAWRPMACAPRTGQRITIDAGAAGELEAHWAQWIEDHPPIEPAFYYLPRAHAQFVPVIGAIGWKPVKA
jgi:hypothetical protein